MPGVIYLIGKEGTLVELKEHAYDSEDVLQALLAQYPKLLAGDQINAEQPRRWLLIKREAAVKDSEDSLGRWSADHLFLDQEGIPTIVEVKRSSDTRIRREVIGQLLDYAANAILYWPVDTLRAWLEALCLQNGTDIDTAINEFLDPNTDVEAFWQQVKTNLQAGRVRLIFIADTIPIELRRVAEFLNNQMEFAEVIAIEIKQYMGEGLKTMVPRVLGSSVERHNRGDTKQWDEPSFFSTLEQKRGSGEATVARKLLDWAKSESLKIYWGRGKIDGSFVPGIEFKGESYYPIVVSTNGWIGIQFYVLKTRSAFEAEPKRKDLLGRLNRIKGISLPDDAIERSPSIPISRLTEKDAIQQFISVLDWIVAEIKKTPTPQN